MAKDSVTNSKSEAKHCEVEAALVEVGEEVDGDDDGDNDDTGEEDPFPLTTVILTFMP